MKAILDAVKAIKGDTSHLLQGWLFVGTDKLSASDVANAVVELENWQPTLSISPLANVTYTEYKERFMSDEKEPKPELVTVEGMQYEIGGIYEFSDNGETWIIDRLTNIDLGDRIPYRFGVKDDTLRYIRALVGNVGKITPAPVDLVDGKAYSFEYIDEDMLGRYHKGSNRFIIGNSNVKAGKVKNIVPLVPEVK